MCSSTRTLRRCAWFVLQNVQQIIVQGNGYLLHRVFKFAFGQLALPKNDYLPACIGQCVTVLLVPSSVVFNLVQPELRVGLGQDKQLAALVPVPETSVDEYRRSVFPHHNVWLPRHTFHVQPVPVSGTDEAVCGKEKYEEIKEITKEVIRI